MEDKLSGKSTILEEIEPGLFTGFEDITALEDKKGLTVFSAIAVVCCIMKLKANFCGRKKEGHFRYKNF